MRFIFLLFVSVVSFAQTPKFSVLNNTPEYVSFAGCPTFGSSTTITSAVGPTVESGELSGQRNVFLAVPYANQMIPNGLAGSLASPYQWQQTNDTDFIGGDVLTAGQQIISSLNNSRYNYFCGLRLVGDSNTGVSGISGFNWLTTNSAGNTVVRVSNTYIKNVSFAGVLYQSTSNTYDTLIHDFVTVSGYPNEGEAFYIGNTGTVTYAPINYAYFTDCFGYNKGREGFQANNHNNLTVQNVTVHDVGNANVAGQNRLVQFQNVHAVIENCIFDGAPTLADIFSNDITFRKCYFRWDGSSGFIGNLQATYASPLAPVNNPAGGGTLKILFDSCYFDPVNPVTNLFEVDEPNADIEIRNSFISDNITNLYLDNRGASNYSLIGTPTTNGNQVLANGSFPRPEYNCLDFDTENCGLVLPYNYYYLLGMGYRTPR